MSQDPYGTENRFPGGHENTYDGGAHRAQGVDDPYRPEQYRGSYQPYQSGFYQPSYERLEGEKAAQLSLIFGLVGFFVAGIVFGPLAIWQARKAEGFGVPATAGKILGWITTILYGLAILAGILFVVIIIAGFGAAASYSN